MLKKYAILIIWTMFISINIFSEKFPDLNILTEEWEPYQYINNGKISGIVVDITAQILKELESNQSSKDIQIQPWTRAYAAALKKENTLIFSMVRSEERENIFKWVGPIMQYTNYLIAKKENNIVIDNKEDILKYKTGTIQNDISETYMKNFDVPKKNLHRTSTPIMNLNLLKNDRIDLLVSEWISFTYEAKSENINYHLYEPVYTITSEGIWYAFNINTPDSVVKAFSDAHKKLIKSGEIDKILDKYSDILIP